MRSAPTAIPKVILAAFREWGTGCLSRLNGMFVFALYDRRQRQLFLARDRAGEKPLFYALVNGAPRFASELKGLMADPALPRRIDPEALDCYLAMGFVPGERCMLQGGEEASASPCAGVQSGKRTIAAVTLLALAL